MRLPILIKRKTKQKIMMLYAVLEKCYPKKMKFYILFFGRGGGSLITIIGVIKSYITCLEGHQ